MADAPSGISGISQFSVKVSDQITRQSYMKKKLNNLAIGLGVYFYIYIGLARKRRAWQRFIVC